LVDTVLNGQFGAAIGQKIRTRDRPVMAVRALPDK
jgi:hypothetical protein